MNSISHDQILNRWKKNNPRRSRWFFSSDILPPRFQDLSFSLNNHLQRVSQSILPLLSTQMTLATFAQTPVQVTITFSLTVSFSSSSENTKLKTFLCGFQIPTIHHFQTNTSHSRHIGEIEVSFQRNLPKSSKELVQKPQN